MMPQPERDDLLLASGDVCAPRGAVRMTETALLQAFSGVATTQVIPALR
jgi:hypothetical protein